jgi:hypothetical protein
VPLLIGEASLGMKYILLHDRYTGGAPLSLPVYISNNLYRELKLPPKTSEIVGNIHLSIQLAYRSTVKYRPGYENTCTRNTKDNEKSSSPEEILTDHQESRPPSTYRSTTESSTQKSAPKDRIVINSRPRKERTPTFEDTLYLEMRVSVTDPYDVFHVKHRNLDLCEGQVSKGQDLVVTSVLFLPGEQGSIHNRLMLSRLSQNFLILQVWRKEQLVGIAKIGTDPIHETYLAGETDSNQCLTFYDGVIDVVDIFEGQKVAELKIKVRVGSQQFIEPPDSSGTATTLCQQQQQNGSTKENSKSVQTSFIECERNKASTPDSLADVNDNHCGTASEDEEVISSKSKQEDDECDSTKTTVNVEICIEEARNLPYLKSEGGKVEPRVYATLLEHSVNLSTQVKVS